MNVLRMLNLGVCPLENQSLAVYEIYFLKNV